MEDNESIRINLDMHPQKALSWWWWFIFQIVLVDGDGRFINGNKQMGLMELQLKIQLTNHNVFVEGLGEEQRYPTKGQ